MKWLKILVLIRPKFLFCASICRNLFFRVSNLLQLGIKLVFVIDGEAPELKWEEMARRTQARYGGGGGGRGRGRGKTAGGGGKKTGRRSNFRVWLKEVKLDNSEPFTSVSMSFIFQ